MIVLVAFVVAGAAGGWIWHAIWAPAPEATGFLVTSGKPVFEAESYIRATGIYALLAGVIGVLLGAALAWVLDRDEVVTLAAVLVGAVIGGRVMAGVGSWLGPDDPPAKVATARQLADVVASLGAESVVIWTVMPAAAVGGAFAVLLTFSKRRMREPVAG